MCVYIHFMHDISSICANTLIAILMVYISKPCIKSLIWLKIYGVYVLAHRFRMVRNTRNSNGVGYAEPPSPSMDPTSAFDHFLQSLEPTCGASICSPTPPLQKPARDKLFERFRALRPEKFDGVFEPRKAEQWLCELECGGQDKKSLMVFQLTYLAVEQWNLEIAKIGEEVIRERSWESFRGIFLGKYFLAFERYKKEMEFLALVQRE